MMPSGAILTSQAAGYMPFASGVQEHRPAPTAGLPFLGGGDLVGSAAAMAVTPMLQARMGQVGMTPFGLGHDQNLFDVTQRNMAAQARMAAVRSAAEADRQAVFSTMRGLAAVTGTPFGGEQRRAAMAIAGGYAAYAPALTGMFPELIDQMAGSRGSGAVMAGRLFDAGRYRTDAVTGRMGMSAESVEATSAAVMSSMFSQAGGRTGLSAGQAGALVQGLQQRGMVAARGSTIDSADLDRLAADPSSAERLRAFDAERVKRSIKEYASAVNAMRDIFGDQGRPNAPMQELLAGLEAMTLGAGSQLSADRMGRMARQTYNLARQGGVGLENALALQQHAAARAQQMGLEPVQAVQATQGALGFGNAYRAQGHAAFKSWGAMDADQLQQMDANLRVQAAGSGMASRMAVTMRLSDTVGGFDENTEAGRYARALRLGLNQYQGADGSLRSVMQSDDDLVRMLSSATRNGRNLGVSEGDVRGMLGQTDTNAEFVSRYGLGDIARRAQGRDELDPAVGGWLGQSLSGQFQERLVAGGMTRQDAAARAARAAGAIGLNVARRMRGMSTEAMADASSRNRGIGDIIAAELEAAGEGDVLAGMDAGQRDAFLRRAADQAYGHVNRSLGTSAYRGFRNYQNLHRLNNEATLDEADRQQMSARFSSEMQDAMSPLGKGSMLSRAVDALQDARPGDASSMQRLLASALGGVKTDDINSALMPAFRQILDKKKAVEELQKQVMDAKDPAAAEALRSQLGKAGGELRAQAEALAKTGESFGLFSNESLRGEDLDRAAASSRRLMSAQNDTAALRGGYADLVTPQEIARMRAGRVMGFQEAKEKLGYKEDDDRLTRDQLILIDQTMGGKQGAAGTEAEARAVLAARNMKDAEDVGRFVAADANAAGIAARVRRLTDTRGRTAAQDKELAELSGRQAEANRLRDEADKALTGDQRAKMEQAVAFIKDKNKGMNDAQARSLVAGMLANNAANLDPGDVRAMMKSMDIRDDGEATALIRANRRLMPGRASDAEVTRVEKEFGGAMSRGEAEELANARLRAARFGVTTDEINARRSGDGPDAEAAAISALMAERADLRAKVTDADREAFRSAPGYAGPSDAQVAAYRRGRKALSGKTDEEVKSAMEEDMILRLRAEDRRKRVDAFLSGDEGGAFREATDQAAQDVENLASRLVSSPQMYQRLGTRAGELSSELRKGQQRLRELAAYHSGGDMSRFMLGDVAGDSSTPEGRAAMAAVADERARIQSRQAAIVAELREQQGERGRRFQLGDEAASRKAVLDAEVAAGRMTAADAAKYMTSSWSPETRERLRRMAAETGSEETARAVHGFPADADLSDYQKSLVAGLRYGAGNAEQAALLYGREAWDGMSDADRAAALSKMVAGTGTDAAAMSLLRLTDADMKGPGGDENRRRVAAVRAGLRSDDQLKILSGIGDVDVDAADETTRRAYRDRMESASLGIGTVARAARKLGLKEDAMPRELQEAVEAERARRGDRLEAERLAKEFGGDRDELARLVGVARRMTPEQERKARELAALDAAQTAKANEFDVPTEYLRSLAGTDGDVLSAEDRRVFDANEAKMAATRAELEKSAASMKGEKVTPEEMAEAAGVTAMLQKSQAEALRRDRSDPKELSRRLLSAYGFRDAGDASPLSAAGSKLAASLEGTAGREFGEAALNSLKLLRDRAGGTGMKGVDEMSRAYFEASGLTGKDRDEAMAAFRAKYKFADGDDAGFGEFERALQFQHNYGLSKVGRDRTDRRTKNTEADVADVAARAVSGGKMEDRAPAAAGAGAPGRMELGGKVSISFTDREIDFSGAWGGARGFPVPGG